MEHTCLIVTDMQHDFMPWGAYPIADSNLIIPFINEVGQAIYKGGGHVVYSMTSHDKDYPNFKENGGFLPTHCVVNTYGVVSVDPIEGYSPPVFLKNDTGASAFKNVKLASYLKTQNIKVVIIVGIPFDSTIKCTAEDAAKIGFRTRVLLAGTKAFNPENTLTQIKLLRDKGVEVV